MIKKAKLFKAKIKKVLLKFDARRLWVLGLTVGKDFLANILGVPAYLGSQYTWHNQGLEPEKAIPKSLHCHSHIPKSVSKLKP